MKCLNFHNHCLNCGCFIKESIFAHIERTSMKNYCIRIRADVNPKKHIGCARHTNVIPLTDDEKQKIEKIQKTIVGNKEFFTKLAKARLGHLKGEQHEQQERT